MSVVLPDRGVLKDQPRDRCTLVVLNGPQPGRVITVQEQEVTIGRGSNASARIEDNGLSRLHARVFRRGDTWYIEDLGSTNGTYVGGQPVRVPQILTDGDRVLVGQSTLLRITFQDQMEQEAAKRAYESTVRDPLTKVHNRRHLDAQMKAEFAYAQRHGTDLSIIIIDVDHFKKINDSLGHLAGDEVLKGLADTLARMVRTEDMVARYGGEEFVVVARGINSANAMILAERIRSRVQGLVVRFEGKPVPVTVSVGIATLSGGEPHKDIAAFFGAADGALYKAKNMGRNRVVHSG
jgi:two-component system cell cycle response regulator